MVRVKVRHPASVPARVGLFIVLIVGVLLTTTVDGHIFYKPVLPYQNELKTYGENNGYFILYN